MSNWIEKALDEIGHSAIGDREHQKQILIKYAPVIDAEKLAEKLLLSCGFIKPHYEKSYWNEMVQKKAQLITDNIELDITWVDGKARWGKWQLVVYRSTLNVGWNWSILFRQKSGQEIWLESGTIPATATEAITDANLDTQELAQQACESALKRIVTGCKG